MQSHDKDAKSEMLVTEDPTAIPPPLSSPLRLIFSVQLQGLGERGVGEGEGEGKGVRQDRADRNTQVG